MSLRIEVENRNPKINQQYIDVVAALQKPCQYPQSIHDLCPDGNEYTEYIIYCYPGNRQSVIKIFPNGAVLESTKIIEYMDQSEGRIATLNYENPTHEMTIRTIQNLNGIKLRFTHMKDQK